MLHKAHSQMGQLWRLPTSSMGMVLCRMRSCMPFKRCFCASPPDSICSRAYTPRVIASVSWPGHVQCAMEALAQAKGYTTCSPDRETDRNAGVIQSLTLDCLCRCSMSAATHECIPRSAVSGKQLRRGRCHPINGANKEMLKQQSLEGHYLVQHIRMKWP